MPRRLNEHKAHDNPSSFTARYKLEICIYFEVFSSIIDAISREKELKKWSRLKKVNLIAKVNPQWGDYFAIKFSKFEKAPFASQAKKVIDEILSTLKSNPNSSSG